MRVELTDDPTVFITRDWDDLAMADPSGTFFHTAAYLKLWWEEFGTGPLVLALVQEEGRTVSTCAFEVVDGTLQFLGGFDVTDYMGPVGLPGCEERAAKELMAALTADVDWDRADLRGLPVESAWHGAIEAAAAAQGHRVQRGEDGLAPVIDLPGTYEAYLASLPAKLRHEIRRKDRRLAAKSGRHRLTAATPETLRGDLDRFFELHRASPGPKGRFMHAGMEIFFRRLGETFLPRHVFHLAFLEIEGRKAAGAIGLGFKNSFSLYNSAFDREFGRVAPGMILVGDLIAWAIDAGRDRFDLLKGDLDYKYRFGAVPRVVGKLVLERG
jgi:CelD/BcsL family acetyltransferase involved in cellulose biosynthesis